MARGSHEASAKQPLKGSGVGGPYQDEITDCTRIYFGALLSGHDTGMGPRFRHGRVQGQLYTLAC